MKKLKDTMVIALALGVGIVLGALIGNTPIIDKVVAKLDD